MSMHPERLKDKAHREILAHVLGRYRDMRLNPTAFPSMALQYIEMEDIFEEVWDVMRDRLHEVSTPSVPEAAPKADVVGNRMIWVLACHSDHEGWYNLPAAFDTETEAVAYYKTHPELVDTHGTGCEMQFVKVPYMAPKDDDDGNAIAVGALRELEGMILEPLRRLHTYSKEVHERWDYVHLHEIVGKFIKVHVRVLSLITRLQLNNEPETTSAKPKRCPTCGEPVANVFDHVDREGIDVATGYCTEINT